MKKYIGFCLIALLVVAFLYKPYTYEEKQAMNLRKSLSLFIEGGKEEVAAQDIFKVFEGKYNQICIFIDKDSEPESAERSFQRKFGKYTVNPKFKYYGAIIVLEGGMGIKLFELNTASISSRGQKYFIYFDSVSLNEQYAGCLPLKSALFRVSRQTLENRILLTIAGKED